MKRLNAIIAVAMLLLLATHALGNALQLFGVGSVVPSALAWMLALLAALHLAIGVVTTMQTFRAQAQAHVAYWGLNKRFWAVRFSGLALALLVICHVLVFGRFGDGPVRLAYFGPVELTVSLLLIVALLVHVLCNLQPLMISLGLPSPRGRAADLAVAFTVLLLVAAAAFVVYFLRWSVI